MKLVADILIALRKQQADLAKQHLSNANTGEALLVLNGMYRGMDLAIETIEQVVNDEDQRQSNL